MPTTTLPEIRARLLALADPGARDFAASLIPHARSIILGVRIPELRKLAKELSRGDWRSLFRLLQKGESMEETMLRGMLPGYAPRIPAEERLSFIHDFIPDISNWCICDSCCSTYGFARDNRPQTWDFLQPCLQSAEEFPARFGVVMLLNHFVKDPEWASRCADILPRVSATGFYAEMALGWCLCELYICHPLLASPLLDERSTPLRPSVLALARRKIRESRRC